MRTTLPVSGTLRRENYFADVCQSPFLITLHFFSADPLEKCGGCTNGASNGGQAQQGQQGQGQQQQQQQQQMPSTSTSASKSDNEVLLRKRTGTAGGGGSSPFEVEAGNSVTSDGGFLFSLHTYKLHFF